MGVQFTVKYVACLHVNYFLNMVVWAVSTNCAAGGSSPFDRSFDDDKVVCASEYSVMS